MIALKLTRTLPTKLPSRTALHIGKGRQTSCEPRNAAHSADDWLAVGLTHENGGWRRWHHLLLRRGHDCSDLYESIRISSQKNMSHYSISILRSSVALDRSSHHASGCWDRAVTRVDSPQPSEEHSVCTAEHLNARAAVPRVVRCSMQRPLPVDVQSARGVGGLSHCPVTASAPSSPLLAMPLCLHEANLLEEGNVPREWSDCRSTRRLIAFVADSKIRREKGKERGKREVDGRRTWRCFPSFARSPCEILAVLFPRDCCVSARFICAEASARQRQAAKWQLQSDRSNHRCAAPASASACCIIIGDLLTSLHFSALI